MFTPMSIYNAMVDISEYKHNWSSQYQGLAGKIRKTECLRGSAGSVAGAWIGTSAHHGSSRERERDHTINDN